MATPHCPTCGQPVKMTKARRCGKCGETKPLTAFAGRDGYCRPCRRQYNRTYQEQYRSTARKNG